MKTAMKCLLLRQRTGTRWTLPRLGAKLTVVLRAWLTALLVCSVGWTVCVAATELDLNELGTLKPNGIRHVSVAEAKQLIEADTDVVVLDVRTGREFRHGHIEARSISIIFPGAFAIKSLNSTKT